MLDADGPASLVVVIDVDVDQGGEIDPGGGLAERGKGDSVELVVRPYLVRGQAGGRHDGEATLSRVAHCLGGHPAGDVDRWVRLLDGLREERDRQRVGVGKGVEV